MRRLLLATLSTFLLLGIPASLVTAAPSKPTVSTLEAELNRVKTAICAKADADSDSYRPFVCPARCGCLSPGFIQNALSCDANGNNFTITSLVAAGRCQAGGGVCEVGSSGQICSIGAPTCFAPGEECQINCQFGICIGVCVRRCASDVDCPSLTATATLSGVAQADSPDAVQCDAGDGTGAKAINSNDALECLNQIQSVTGTCP